MTDNGSRWDGYKMNIRDKTERNFNYKIRTTFQLINHFKKNRLPDQIIINAHPARWNDNFGVWIYRFFLQKTKNAAKYLLNYFLE